MSKKRQDPRSYTSILLLSTNSNFNVTWHLFQNSVCINKDIDGQVNSHSLPADWPFVKRVGRPAHGTEGMSVLKVVHAAAVVVGAVRAAFEGVHNYYWEAGIPPADLRNPELKGELAACSFNRLKS